MSKIEVLSRTQRIIITPNTSLSVNVISKTQKIIVNPKTSSIDNVVSKTQRIVVNPNASISVKVFSRTQKIVVQKTNSVSIVNAGPLGPTGLKGDTGSPGLSATDPESISYIHVQEIPSSEWVIQHNLSFRPAGVYVQDTSGTNIEGDVSYVSPTVVVVTFSAAFAGLCYLS